MKIKHIIKHKQKMLKLNLIKTKTYKSAGYSFKIEDIENRLKKALQIIYQFHINNKKILFVGNFLNLNKGMGRALLHTNHTVIPESLWKNYAFNSNKIAKNKNISEILLKLKKRSDLIVLVNKKFNENIIKEGYNFKIPIIYFNSFLNKLDNNFAYKIPGNFLFENKRIQNNLLCSLLVATIKKANRTKSITIKNKRKNKLF